jgi:hypothetical protein
MNKDIRIDFLKRKILRSRFIAEFLYETDYKKLVIFSCGNAANAIIQRMPNFPILAICPGGDLAPTKKWWTPEEIHRAFPDRFDATSGHLPLSLMVRMAKELKTAPVEWLDSGIPQAGYSYTVPTGSGETILLLRWAFPASTFIPLYNISIGTEYSVNAPLNFLVRG